MINKIVSLLVLLIVLVSSSTSCANRKIQEEDVPLPVQKIEPIISSYYTVTEDEREILARLVFLESSICSTECQRAVVSVVFNRLESHKWGDSLYDVIYYPNAFEPVHKIPYTTPTQEAYEVVDYVIQNGPTIPTYVRYFRTSYDFPWEGYTNYCSMDNVYFGYFLDWENGVW